MAREEIKVYFMYIPPPPAFSWSKLEASVLSDLISYVESAWHLNVAISNLESLSKDPFASVCESGLLKSTGDKGNYIICWH